MLCDYDPRSVLGIQVLSRGFNSRDFLRVGGVLPCRVPEPDGVRRGVCVREFTVAGGVFQWEILSAGCDRRNPMRGGVQVSRWIVGADSLRDGLVLRRVGECGGAVPGGEILQQSVHADSLCRVEFLSNRFHRAGEMCRRLLLPHRRAADPLRRREGVCDWFHVACHVCRGVSLRCQLVCSDPMRGRDGVSGWVWRGNAMPRWNALRRGLCVPVCPGSILSSGDHRGESMPRGIVLQRPVRGRRVRCGPVVRRRVDCRRRLSAGDVLRESDSCSGVHRWPLLRCPRTDSASSLHRVRAGPVREHPVRGVCQRYVWRVPGFHVLNREQLAGVPAGGRVRRGVVLYVQVRGVCVLPSGLSLP